MEYERKSNTKIPDEWFAEAELPKHEAKTDWSSFRREAAKDILCAMLFTKSGANPEDVTMAIEIADELIKQLKEK